MKLASGIAPATRFLSAGIPVGLGTDGSASNNDLDMMGEMRTAALFGKHAAGAASALDAGTVLRMATIEGAQAVGLGDEVGSLEPGKQADLILMDLTELNLSPVPKASVREPAPGRPSLSTPGAGTKSRR